MDNIGEKLSPLEIKQKEVEARAKELSARLGRRVFHFIFQGNKGPDDFVVGFIKDPDRMDKMRAIDLYETSRTGSGAHVVITSLIKEESDPRVMSEDSENDSYFLGAIDFAITECVLMHLDLAKKK